MNPGMLVWCTIQVTLNIMGTPDTHYQTAAKGIVRSVFGQTLLVDFESYAKSHKYIGDYHAVELPDYMCTRVEE